VRAQSESDVRALCFFFTLTLFLTLLLSFWEFSPYCPVPLKLKTARDCYATTLKPAGVSKDNIGEMPGHSNLVVTEHYLASLDIEKTKEIVQLKI